MRVKVSFLVMLLTGLTGYVSRAQTFTAKAGFGLSNMRWKTDRASSDFDQKPGFHAGLAAELPINSWLSVEPAMLYSNKGGKFNGTYANFQHSLHYLDVPLNFKAARQLKGNIRIYAAAGPYFGIGLVGRTKGHLTGYEEMNFDINEKVRWGSDGDDKFRRLEFGATFGAGVEVKKLQIGLSYDLGLSNISSYQDDYFSWKNRVAKLSVGWMFGKK